MNEAATHTSPRLHPIEAVMERLCLGRSMVFSLLSDGQLRSVKVGRRRLVPESAISDFIERLESRPHCPPTGRAANGEQTMDDPRAAS